MSKGHCEKDFSESYVQKKERIETEIDFYKKKLEEDRKRVEDYIAQAPYPECDIIRYRVINNLSLEEMGDFVGYSRRQTSKKFWIYIKNDQKDHAEV